MTAPTDPNQEPQFRGNRHGYSAKVRLWVELADERLKPGQVCDGRLYFDEPVSIPAQAAELVIEIDGDADRYEIKILGETVTAPASIARYERSVG